MNLQELGFTKEELQQRVVDQAVRELFDSSTYDEDGEVSHVDSPLHRQLNEAIRKHIDAKINELAEQHVLPKVTEMVENLTLQETNKWGEKKGEKLSFVEYLAQRADYYLREEVNYSGKTRAEDSYSWSKYGTRCAHLIHEHLHYAIERAMKEAISNANQSIIGGLQEAVKIKLAEVANSLQVAVKTK